MQLSKNSWHYKLHRMSYVDKPATNLCPYFWSIVWALFMFITFNFLWTFPLMLWDAIRSRTKEEWDNSCTRKYPYFKDDRFFSSLGLNSIIFLSYCLIVMRWHIPESELWSDKCHFTWHVGMMVFTAITIFGIFLGLYFLVRWLRPKKKEPSLLGAFLKAKKEKYCPLIEWKDDTKTVQSTT